MGMRKIWPGCAASGEGRIGCARAQANFPADEFQAAVAHERAGQKAGFHQNLETVAYAEHQPACGRELFDRAHHRRKLGDGAAAQIVAIGETARQNDGIDIAERGGTVPDEFSRLTEIMRDGVSSIVVAIASGKDNDAKFHVLWGRLQTIVAWEG